MKTIFCLLLLLLLACEKDSSKSETLSLQESKSVVVDDNKTEVNLTWNEEFLDLVNDHRRSLGLRALLNDDGFNTIALIHSKNMANGTVAFGHTGFSSRCSDAKSLLGGGNWCGENVAYGQKTPQAVFTSWMNSSGHRANIEQSRATHMGFGYAKNGNGTYYWTQAFLEI